MIQNSRRFGIQTILPRLMELRPAVLLHRRWCVSAIALALTWPTGVTAANVELPRDFSVVQGTGSIYYESFTDNRSGGAATPAELPYVGVLDIVNGNVVFSGPTYQHQVFSHHTAMYESTRDLLLLHPRLSASESLAASVAFDVTESGLYQVVGRFARANDYRLAGDGVVVMVFVNENTVVPLMEAAISADHLVDPDDPFSGTGTAGFDEVVWLDPGDSLRFGVFGGPIGSVNGNFDVTALDLSITALAISDQVAKLLASDGAGVDHFGSSVAINGGTVVVGAPHDDDNGSDSGSAYVFERDHGGVDNWSEAAKLTASDGAEYESFGGSIALSGDTVVVGASFDGGSGYHAGSAYVFERDQGGADNWGQATKLTASDAASYDNFGWSVAISSDTVVVGASGDDDNGSRSGSAYVFERDHGGADNWGEAAKLTASDGGEIDLFGVSVAIRGDTVVIGADADDENGSGSGSAYVFERDHGGADNWGESTKLTASDGVGGDRFGRSVALSGDTVVVGALYDNDNGSNSGSAYVFERDHGGADNWGESAKLTAPDGAENDLFSSSVAISGGTVIVGAINNDDNGSNSGSTYVFERDRGGADNWGQTAKLTASDGAENDRFSSSVAISGGTVIVGANGDDDNGSASGSAYIFIINTLFADDFETGDTSAWTMAAP
jgi:FG-GAP repeat